MRTAHRIRGEDLDTPPKGRPKINSSQNQTSESKLKQFKSIFRKTLSFSLASVLSIAQLNPLSALASSTELDQIQAVATIELDVTEWNYNYTGKVEEFTAPASGKYFIEAYGASGGGVVSGDKGGFSGYSAGYLNMIAGEKLYIVVGQQGKVNGSATYNGGGAGGNNAGAGGGASSVTKTNRGELKNFANYKSEVVIVAGGGGGQNSVAHYKGESHNRVIGTGGGLRGGASDNATGGSQVDGYAFGQGQSASASYDWGGAGGGGWYGGTASSYRYYGGGGGSGYVDGVYNSTTSNQGKRVGNGTVKIGYAGEVLSSLTLEIGNNSSYDGVSGTVVIEGQYGDSIVLTPPDMPSGYKFDSWKYIDGAENLDLSTNVYTFTGENSVYKAIYEAPLTLDISTKDLATQGYIKLQWEQDDEISKKFVIEESADKTTWYELMSNDSTFIDRYTSTYASPGIYEYEAPMNGIYNIKLYGAQGGAGYSAAGGKGAYVSGQIILNKGQKIYIQVGGQNGYNGGGSGRSGGSYASSGSGGGATSVTTTNRGVLSAFNSYRSEILAVAAGGGGGGGGGTWGGPVTTGGAGGASEASGGNAGSSQGREVLNGKPGKAGTTSSGGSGGATGSHHSHGSDNTYYTGGGGGGGGGYFGGGGGGAGFLEYSSSGSCSGNAGSNGSFGQGGAGGAIKSGYGWHSGAGAGGGGGSNYISSALTETTETNGVQAGNGKAIIAPAASFSELAENTVGVYTADVAAPNIPSSNTVESYEVGKAIVQWNEVEDNGNTYYYRVKSYKQSDDSLLKTSNVVTANCTTGVKGYYYTVDTNINTVVTTAHTFADRPYIISTFQPNTQYYFHVAAIDHAGNISGTYTFELPPYYNTTYIDMVDNVNGAKLGETIVPVAVGTVASGEELGTSTVADAYYKGYFYSQEFTTVVVQGPPNTGQNVVYRFFKSIPVSQSFNITTESGLGGTTGDERSYLYPISGVTNGYWIKADGVTEHTITSKGSINSIADNNYQIDKDAMLILKVPEVIPVKESWELNKNATTLTFSNKVGANTAGLNILQSKMSGTRSSDNKTVTVNHKFTIGADRTGQIIEICPSFSGVYKGLTYESDLANDSSLKITLKADGVKPIINGGNTITETTHIEEDVWLTFSALDEHSGLKEFTIRVENQDNGKVISETFSGTNATGNKQIKMTKSNDAWIGELLITLEAVDNVGNVIREQYTTLTYTLDCECESLLIESEGEDFRQGETGELIFWANGYPDYVDIKLPSELVPFVTPRDGFIEILDNDLGGKTIRYIYTNKDKSDRNSAEIETTYFKAPLYIDEKLYDIEVSSYKNGKLLATRTVQIDVLETILGGHIKSYFK